MSKRLELVTEFAGGGRCAADMGTDHGYVPIALVLRGLADRAIAILKDQGEDAYLLGEIVEGEEKVVLC